MTPGLYIDRINSGENPRDMINSWYQGQPESTRMICGRESVQEPYIRVERLDFGEGPAGYEIYFRFPDLDHIDTAFWKPQLYVLKFLPNGKLGIDADRTWPDRVVKMELARTRRKADEAVRTAKSKALRDKTAEERMIEYFKSGGNDLEKDDEEEEVEKKEVDIPFSV